MSTRKQPAEIREIRSRHPDMRARDFARIHKISEGELIAAQVGQTATIAIEANVEKVLKGLRGAGDIMALTRNESCVSEKIGPIETVHVSPHAAMVIGEQIDLRIFPKHWHFGFAVERSDAEGGKHHSLQFFDASGTAVHKIHARSTTDMEIWAALVAKLALPEQSDAIAITLPEPESEKASTFNVATLRERWGAMTDSHQVFGLLRELNISRLQALPALGPDWAWPLDTESISALFNTAAASGVPLMAFVSNKGCTQIHSGPITTVKPMGPWLNVMDPTFHMHLRLDQIASVWAVRKPIEDGFLTSVEVFGEDNEVIIHLVGKRNSKQAENPEWRVLVDNLPRLAAVDAA